MRHLNAQGYDVIRDWLPTSIAFRDRSGREVDLHPLDPTPDGGGDQVLPDDEERGTTRHPSKGRFEVGLSGARRRRTKY
jgi:hypothetical protein